MKERDRRGRFVSTNTIRPYGVMADIDPLGWGTITQQRRRLERKRERQARRQRPRAPKTRRWPQRMAPSQALRRLIAGHQPANPSMPVPVSVYAGRYEAGIMWREDVETFAAYLTDTNPAGEREARWVGSHPGQYPTVESLAEALNAYAVGIDRGSLAVAQTYQRAVWAVAGSCHLAGTHLPDGRAPLAVITPKGNVQPIGPAPQRDHRSMPFGQPTPLAWGQEGNPRGALETARIVLDYTDSTTRNDDQLFDDARTFAVTIVRRWPPTFSVAIADIHTWSRTRAPITVLTSGTPIDRLLTNPPPATVPVPSPARPPHPETVQLRSGPTLTEVTAATLANAVDLTDGRPAPIQRPPKRRPPIARELS